MNFGSLNTQQINERKQNITDSMCEFAASQTWSGHSLVFERFKFYSLLGLLSGLTRQETGKLASQLTCIVITLHSTQTQMIPKLEDPL